MNEVTVFILVDENGDFVAHHDRDCLPDQWEDHIGGTAINSRVVKATILVPEPEDSEVKGVLSAISGPKAKLTELSEA